jgi:hypothetical protein
MRNCDYHYQVQYNATFVTACTFEKGIYYIELRPYIILTLSLMNSKVDTTYSSVMSNSGAKWRTDKKNCLANSNETPLS